MVRIEVIVLIGTVVPVMGGTAWCGAESAGVTQISAVTQIVLFLRLTSSSAKASSLIASSLEVSSWGASSRVAPSKGASVGVIEPSAMHAVEDPLTA